MKRLFYVFASFCCVIGESRTMQRPDAVFFNAEAVVEQDISAKKVELAKLLYGSYVLGVTEGRLMWRIRSAFGISPIPCTWHELKHPVEAAEYAARAKFFEVLGAINFAKQPVTLYEGVTLPPLLAAWVHDPEFTSDKAMHPAHAHINTLDKSAEDKEFLHATVQTSLDPDIMSRTCALNKKAVEVLDACRKQRIPAYMVGFCAKESRQCLEASSDAKGVLRKFKKIFFSHQTPVDEHTRFDDQFWVNHIVQTGEVMPQTPVFVESARIVDAVHVPHYKVDDPALLHVVDKKQ